MSKETEVYEEPLFDAVRRLLIMQAVARTRRFGRAAKLIGVGSDTVVKVLRDAGFQPREKPDGIFAADLQRLRSFLADAKETDPGFDRAHLGC